MVVLSNTHVYYPILTHTARWHISLSLSFHSSSKTLSVQEGQTNSPVEMDLLDSALMATEH